MAVLLNKWIDAVARDMCVELGLDPDEDVALDEGSHTPLERAQRSGDLAWRGKRWRNFRRDASIALAAHVAIARSRALFLRAP